MNNIEEKLRDILIQEFSTGSKNAIEAAVFLYLNKENAYPDREIYENVKQNINTDGITPERTFSTEIRKYTDNSPQKLTVSHRKLFTIINLEESPQRFLLIEEVRNIIDNHFKSLTTATSVWKCPKTSCNSKEITISRNNDNIIDGKTYTDIIIHFLQHLSQKNPLFGSTDIIRIFLENTPRGVLSIEDKGEYIYDGRTSDKIWKNQIRSSLNSLRSRGYITTENSMEVIEKYNLNVKDRRKLRKRKRTDLFKSEFKLFDDWEIFSYRERKDVKKYWIFQKPNMAIHLESKKHLRVSQASIAWDYANFFPSVFCKNLQEIPMFVLWVKWMLHIKNLLELRIFKLSTSRFKTGHKRFNFNFSQLSTTLCLKFIV